MKIATYNVNSLRKRLPLVLAWLEQQKPDVMCLQETKVQDSEFPIDSFREAGYHATFRGMKAYNGVATLSRVVPDAVQHGFCEGADSEDVRILQTTIHGVTILNTYVPQGHSIKSDKYQYKLDWFRRMRQHLEDRFQPSDPVIWLGDLNVAPEPVDVYHPDRRVNDVDFHIDARNAFQEVVGWGFTDTFRQLHPDRIQYTYWDYFRNAFQNNWGWRIDHILATAGLAAQCRQVDVDVEPRKAASASDHTVVWAEFA
jgi:exodeoxyribonuclease-3